MRSKKTDDFIKNALNKMFQFVGFEGFDQNFVKQEEWYSLKSWTEEERETFRTWFLLEAKTKMQWSKKTAEREFAYYDLMWGWATNPNKANK